MTWPLLSRNANTQGNESEPHSSDGREEESGNCPRARIRRRPGPATVYRDRRPRPATATGDRDRRPRPITATDDRDRFPRPMKTTESETRFLSLQGRRSQRSDSVIGFGPRSRSSAICFAPSAAFHRARAKLNRRSVLASQNFPGKVAERVGAIHRAVFRHRG